MDDREKQVQTLYTSDQYLANNPTLHEEDSPWKITLLLPLLDQFARQAGPSGTTTVLDCGGGKGLILQAVSEHLRKSHALNVRKYALDLSPGMLEAQKRQNPDLLKMLQEDIGHTTLKDKEVDLTMLIDVIEHVGNPTSALREIRRFSKFALFKVPLEDNWFPRVWNWAKRGKPRREAAAGIGHINYYSFASIKRQLEQHCGTVIASSYGNIFAYYRTAPHYQNRPGLFFKTNRVLGEACFAVSSKLSSGILFEDCAQFLVKCG